MSKLLFYSPESKVIDSLLGRITLRIQREPICICEAKLFSIFQWEAKTGSRVFQVCDIEKPRSWLPILILISHILPYKTHLIVLRILMTNVFFLFSFDFFFQFGDILKFLWSLCLSCHFFLFFNGHKGS